MLAESGGTFKDDVVKGLIAGGFGLAGTLITTGLAWAKDRDQSNNRVRIIEEAGKRVQFWDSWVKVVTSLSSDQEAELCRARAKAETLDASKSVEAIFTAHSVVNELARSSDFETRKKGMVWIARWLLLYKPPRARAWFPRLMFYIYACAIPISLVQWGMAKSPAEADDATSLLLGSIILCVIFWPLSVWLEKPKHEGPSTG